MTSARQVDRLEGRMKSRGTINVKSKQTRIHLPDCLASDSPDTTALSLFSDEIETRQGEPFQKLQAFWKRKSGGHSDVTGIDVGDMSKRLKHQNVDIQEELSDSKKKYPDLRCLESPSAILSVKSRDPHMLSAPAFTDVGASSPADNKVSQLECDDPSEPLTSHVMENGSSKKRYLDKDSVDSDRCDSSSSSPKLARYSEEYDIEVKVENAPQAAEDSYDECDSLLDSSSRLYIDTSGSAEEEVASDFSPSSTTCYLSDYEEEVTKSESSAATSSSEACTPPVLTKMKDEPLNTLESDIVADELEEALATPVTRVLVPCKCPDLRCLESPSAILSVNSRDPLMLWSPTFSDVEAPSPEDNKVYELMSQDDLSQPSTSRVTGNGSNKKRYLDIDSSNFEDYDARNSATEEHYYAVKLERSPEADEDFSVRLDSYDDCDSSADRSSRLYIDTSGSAEEEVTSDFSPSSTTGYLSDIKEEVTESESSAATSSSEACTPPVLTQFPPAHLGHDGSYLSAETIEPLNLSYTACEGFNVDQSRSYYSNPEMGHLAHAATTYEPVIGMLDNDSSDYWKEIGVTGTNFSRTPTQATSVYAYHIWSNSLTDNAGDYINISQQERPFSAGSYLGINMKPSHCETVTYRETHLIKDSPFCSTVSYVVEKPVAKAMNSKPPVAASVRTVRPVTASNKTFPGDDVKEQETGDLFALLDESVRSRMENELSNVEELCDNLKNIRPYVISGIVSTTYLISLMNKTDLVNDMFQDALDGYGKIKTWVLENCRKTTPAILAKDLVFRLFTIDELENLNLQRLSATARMKAIRDCLKSTFPEKFTQCCWKKRCLPLIKSSVTILFKHKVRHVQQFYARYKK